MGATRIDRNTRIRMLLTSYLDAVPGLRAKGEVQTSRSKPGSTIPHSGDLWSRGSYQELEDALERISLESRQRLWLGYVWQPDRRRRVVQAIYRKKEARRLRLDVEMLARIMPRRILVPKVVVDNWNDHLSEKPKRNTDVPVSLEGGSAPYTKDEDSRSAPAAPVQTGNQERERLGGND